MTRKSRDQLSRPFAIWYYYDTRHNLERFVIAKGFSTSLVNAKGTAARHIAREDYYPKAVIVDRRINKIILKMTRSANGINFN